MAHTGTVVGHWQRKDHWPTDFRVPYLVILDDGSIIFCPRSDDDFIRESDVPPVTVLFNIGSRVECQLGTDGEWFPGTGMFRFHLFICHKIEKHSYEIHMLLKQISMASACMTNISFFVLLKM